MAVTAGLIGHGHRPERATDGEDADAVVDEVRAAHRGAGSGLDGS